MKNGLERQLAKKWPNVSTYEISKFFLLKTFKKDDVQQKQFLQGLGLLAVKNHFCIILWKIPSSKDLFYICVLELSSHPKNYFPKKFCLTWWRKQKS